MDVRHYLAADGRDTFQDWFDSLEDARVRVAILRRVDRLARHNAGDCRFCHSGVWELRIDLGPGFRVHYAKANAELILLLGGGPKRTQQADIETAVERWKHYRSRR